MFATPADGSAGPGDRLYLGSRADLDALVDPCDDDRVEYVSAGSTRLGVIDRVTCS